MSRLRFCLLLVVICSCAHLGETFQDDTIILPLIKPSQAPDTTTENITTTTDPSTTPPNTTTPSTTTSTTTPSTTTTSTTTPSTTSTTTTSTTTSTAAPTTSTTPAPPGPVPPPKQGSWNYTDTEKNVTCIVIQFSAQLNVTYTKVVNSSTILGNVIINVPADAEVVGGNCTDSGDQWLTLSWPSTNASLANNMTIVYHNNSTMKNYGVKSFNISLAPDNFVNASSTGPIELSHGSEWETPLATSYRCKVPTTLNMTSDTASTVSQLTLFTLQEEAYRTSPGGGFSAARDCGGGDVPDAVPIAVGCALGGLVVVVLIAYLVGRRRSAARGYLSM